MSRSSRFRAPFVVTLASVATTLVACGGSTSSDSQATGGASTGGASTGGASTGGTGNSGGTGNVGGGGAPGCPAVFPSGDVSCSLPDGTTCYYDQGSCCPPWEAICSGGKWMALASSCNPPPPDPCPATPPQDGTACGSSDPCGQTYNYCPYGKCADGSPATLAECNGGTWKLSYVNCAPPPCDSLTACECFDRADCQALSDGCLCECDYSCPGKPPCDCVCGGGAYLGCKAI
jgi:hypothetical protein